MEYSRNSPYSTDDLDYSVSITKTKPVVKVQKAVKEKTKSTFTELVHSLITRIPFPPSFKGFNGVKVILYLTFLHRVHFYSVHAFITNLSATRVSDNDADDADEDSLQTANAFLAFSLILGSLTRMISFLIVNCETVC